MSEMNLALQSGRFKKNQIEMFKITVHFSELTKQRKEKKALATSDRFNKA